MPEPKPTEFLSAVVGLFPEFAVYWDTEGDIFRDDDGSFTYHGLFAVFSHYVRDHYSEMAEDKREEVFRFIESCVSGRVVPDEVEDAVHTCFIENLAGDLPPDEVKRYMKPKTLKMFKYYEA